MLKPFLIGFLLLGFVLGAVPALASPHAASGPNPFKAGAHAHKAHCLLHGHHLDGPCPHLAKGRGHLPVRCAVSRECGGSPVGTLPVSGFTAFPVCGDPGVYTGFPTRSVRLDTPLPTRYTVLIPDLPDPPPKF